MNNSTLITMSNSSANIVTQHACYESSDDEDTDVPVGTTFPTIELDPLTESVRYHVKRTRLDVSSPLPSDDEVFSEIEEEEEEESLSCPVAIETNNTLSSSCENVHDDELVVETHEPPHLVTEAELSLATIAEESYQTKDVTTTTTKDEEEGESKMTISSSCGEDEVPAKMTISSCGEDVEVPSKQRDVDLLPRIGKMEIVLPRWPFVVLSGL